jgi:hypothetical protein
VAQLLEMSRELPDGGILRWVLSFPPPLVGDGIVPFLIRWGRGPHPSETSPGGCELLDLLAEHPDPGPARALLAAMAVDLPLKPGPAPALIATVRCPRGLIELR